LDKFLLSAKLFGVLQRQQSAPELPSGGCATAVGAVGGGELDLGALMRLK